MSFPGKFYHGAASQLKVIVAALPTTKSIPRVCIYKV